MKDRFTAKLSRRGAFARCWPCSVALKLLVAPLVFSQRTHESKSLGVLLRSSHVECTLSVDRFDGREDACRFRCCMHLSIYCFDNGEALGSPCRIKARRRYIAE